jgi:hypothetical protein
MENNAFFQKIDWVLVQKEVNKRLKSNYERHYLQAVYRGNLFSSVIKETLDELLPPYRRTRKAA